MKYLECTSCGKKAAWVTFWGNLVLTLFKGIIGFTVNSHALIADAIHSAADVIIAIVTVAAIHISGKGPDKEHPYGHGKVEFIAAAVVTAGLLVAVVFLFKEALNELKMGVITNPGFVAFFAAVLGAIASELMFKYNLCAGKELHSPALIANAWHNRYDVYTSIVVAVGTLGAILGLRFLDPIAAIVVGIVILKVAVNIFRDAYTGLMDTRVPLEEKKEIETLIAQIKEVKKIIVLKTRQMGQKAWVDLVIQVDPSKTVEQGYSIAEKVKEILLLKMESIGNVQVEVIS